MIRKTWKPALALGAVLAVAQTGSAEDRDTLRTGGGPTGATMTLGGKGTAAQAATEDTELTHGYRRHGGFYGWGGGWGGYRGYYGGGWGGGYYAGWGGYRPYYGWGGYRSYTSFSISAYQPAFYYGAPVYYRPAYYDCYDGWGGYGYGSGVGISVGLGRIGANAAALSTPTITLGSTLRPATPAAQPLVQPMVQPMAVPAAPGGTFPYDGGPANPVPLPAPDAPGAKPMSPPVPQTGATDLPVSLKPKAPASPYRYKAYGEK